MSKTIYFISPNQPNYIKVKNPKSTSNTLKIYFNGSNLKLFKLENSTINNYNSLSNAYTLTLDALQEVYLEIYPNCSEHDIHQSAKCFITNSNGNIYDIYNLALELNKPSYEKTIGLYSGFPQKFNDYIKDEYETFALTETNPNLTGNIKIQVNTKDKLFISLFNNIGVNNIDLYNREIKKNSDYIIELHKLSKDIPNIKELFYKNHKNIYNNNTINNISSQKKYDIYKSGVSTFPNKYQDEKLSIFAPIYITNKIPENFVIFKRLNKIKDIKKEELFKDIEIIKVYNLSKETNLGNFIHKTKNYKNFEKSHVETIITDNGVTLAVSGIDILNSNINTIYEDITEYTNKESYIKDFESDITKSYMNNNLVSHKILNFEFLFDDTTTVEGDYASYFGMYVDKLELETFDIDTSKYNNIEQTCMLSNTYKSNHIHTKSSINLKSKFINDNNRIFYYKPKNDSYNIHTIKSLEKIDGYNKFIFHNDINLCNLIFKENVYNINKKNIDDINTTFIDLEFKSNLNGDETFTLIDDISRYTIDIIDDIDINSTLYEEPTLITIDEAGVVGGEVKVLRNLNIPDGDEVTLFDSSNEEILVTVAHSYSDGDDTYIQFDDSVDLSDISNIKYIYKSNIKHTIQLKETKENTINEIVKYLNLNELPYKAISIGNKIRIYSTSNNKFTLHVDYSRSDSNLDNILYFGNVITPNSSSINSKVYNYKTITLKSSNPIASNESIIYLDDNPYKLTNEIYLKDDYKTKINNIIDGYNVVKSYTDKYLIKITNIKNYDETQIYNLSKNSIGLFSIYDTKEFDFNIIKNDYDYYLDEYRKVYKIYNQYDILINRQYYKVINNNDSDLILNIEYSIYNKFDFKLLKQLTIRPNSESHFSTFLTDYQIQSFGVKYDFRYTIKSGDYFKVILNSTIEDENIIDIIPEFPTNIYNSQNIKNYINQSIQNKNPSSKLILTNDIEYDRLQENSNINSDINDVIEYKTCKWTSWDNKDVKGDDYRLNLSPAFGIFNGSVVKNSYSSSPLTHSHEWFVLEEFPSYLSKYEGSQKIYNFSKINRNNLLDINTDYFSEYFNNGYPLIKKDESYTKFGKSKLYSIIKKQDSEKYQTFFKGVKYLFTSKEDISDYKFNISVSTRPDETIIPENLGVCAPDDIPFGCNTIGLLPDIRNLLPFIALNNIQNNIKVTLIKEGSPVLYEITPPIGVTSILDGSLFDINQFKTEVDNSFKEWANLLNEVYSKNNNYPNDSLFNFYTEYESNIFQATSAWISQPIKDTLNIGTIRIGFAPMESNIIAKSFYIDVEEYNNKFYYQTPTILLNSNLNFRLDSNSTAPNSYSLKYVLIHEIGHILGLGHTNKDGSIMNPEIKTKYTYSNLYPDGLKLYVDGKCIEETYGDEYKNNYNVPTTPSEIACSNKRERVKDSYEFIINKKFKNITLKIYSDIPNYMSLDSIKSYFDIYISNNLRRYYKENDEYGLEGLDVSVPPMNLSYSGIDMKHNYFEINPIIANNDRLSDSNIGANILNKQYRIRNIAKDYNFHIPDYTLDTDYIKYNLYQSYDSTGNLNKKMVFNIKDNETYLNDYTPPLMDTQYWEESFMYKIGGGLDLYNYNYKLSIDYFITNINNIKQTVVSTNGTISTDSILDVDMINPKQCRLNKLYSLDLINNNPATFNNSHLNQHMNIYRHEMKYDPKFNVITQFGLRDEYELSLDLGIDLFKCNTRILWENPKFGLGGYKYYKKVSDNRIIFNKDLGDNTFNKLDPEKSTFPVLENYYSGVFDSNYYIKYINMNTIENIDGMEDIMFNKNILNSTMVNPIQIITRISPTSYITYEVVNNILTIIVDEIGFLRDSLANSYIERFKLIYTGSEINDSLYSMIDNEISYNYGLNSILLYNKNSTKTEYLNSIDGMLLDQNVKSERKDNQIIITKELVNDIQFSIKLTYKYL